MEKISNNNVTGPSLRQNSQHKINSCNVATFNIKCTYCQGEHNVYSCKEFKHLTISERLKHVKSKGLCLNCLRGKHFAKDCTSKNCKVCNKRHNSLLHVENSDKSESKTKQDHKEIDSNEKSTDNVVCNHSNLHEVSLSQVLFNSGSKNKT